MAQVCPFLSTLHHGNRSRWHSVHQCLHRCTESVYGPRSGNLKVHVRQGQKWSQDTPSTKTGNCSASWMMLCCDLTSTIWAIGHTNWRSGLWANSAGTNYASEVEALASIWSCWYYNVAAWAPRCHMSGIEPIASGRTLRHRLTRAEALLLRWFQPCAQCRRSRKVGKLVWYCLWTRGPLNTCTSVTVDINRKSWGAAP